MSSANQSVRFPAVGRLGRLSAVMCFVVAIGGALAELALAWIWLDPDLVRSLIVPGLGLSSAPIDVSAAARLVGFTIAMLAMSVLLYMLHHAYQLFDQYRLGDVFAADAPRRLRVIGQSMLALAVLRPVAGALLAIALTVSNPPGQRFLAISISLDDYMIAAVGGLLLAIGHVMAEATRMAEEHQQIV